MASTAIADVDAGSVAGAGQVLDGSNPAVARVRQLIGGSDSPDGWSRCWEEGVTPWDLGQATPAVVKLAQSGTLPSSAAAAAAAATVLVPGCGAGHDVVALSGPGRFVVGLDVSDAAIQRAKQNRRVPAVRETFRSRSREVNQNLASSKLSLSSPNRSFFTFVAADFFTWEPPEPFALIFDYTFFCAVHPSLRSAWARRMGDLLQPDGELITLMYSIEEQEAGPPFNTTVLDYEEVLKPLGFVVNSIEDNQVAVEPRKGMEKIARWKRTARRE